MKRARTITLVSFAATVLASCDGPPTVQECWAAAAAAGGSVPSVCGRVLERNEAAFLTGGGLQPDADQCLAFARNDSYPESCERHVDRATGTVSGSGGGSHAWIFVDRRSAASPATALRSRGWARPAEPISSTLKSTTAIPRAAASSHAPAPRAFSIFAPSRGGFVSGSGVRGVSPGG